MPANDLVSKIETGLLVATEPASGMQICYDKYRIHYGESQIKVEAVQQVLGPSGFNQNTVFELSNDWLPQHLKVTGEHDAYEAIFNFQENETVFKVSTRESPPLVNTYPVGQALASVMVTGTLFMPLIWAKRFNFDNPVPQHYHFVPHGFCQVKRLEDLHREDATYRQLGVKLLLYEQEDFLRLVVSTDGKLLEYKTKNLSLNVKLEELSS
jgi:hypothetical protein